MEFTYNAYRSLVDLLNKGGYHFVGYCDEASVDRAVIMRHDVDFCLSKALAMAELEHKLRVKSTYFVLLSTDFYNVFSKRSNALLTEILACGHDIGLHFDEIRYQGANLPSLCSAMVREAGLLAEAISADVKAVSMHRPSKAMLESDISLPGLVNSYSSRFFSEYKYLSDSRMRWREDVKGIVSSKEFDKLHILTHPFWYSEESETAQNKLRHFIAAAGAQRRCYMDENFTALNEIISG